MQRYVYCTCKVCIYIYIYTHIYIYIWNPQFMKRDETHHPISDEERCTEWEVHAALVQVRVEIWTLGDTKSSSATYTLVICYITATCTHECTFINKTIMLNCSTLHVTSCSIYIYIYHHINCTYYIYTVFIQLAVEILDLPIEEIKQ